MLESVELVLALNMILTPIERVRRDSVRETPSTQCLGQCLQQQNSIVERMKDAGSLEQPGMTMSVD